MKESEGRPTTKKGPLHLWEMVKVPDDKVRAYRAGLENEVNRDDTILRFASPLEIELGPKLPSEQIARADRDWAQRELRKLDKNFEQWRLSKILWFRLKNQTSL